MAQSKNKVLKEAIVDSFLAHGWIANTEYYASVNERGQFTQADGSVHPWCTDNHLKSPSGRYAVRVKDQVLTLHDSQRSYSKILSMQFNYIEMLDNGLKCGCLLLMYDEGQNCTSDS